jgi:hypothetical protein
MAQEFSDDFEQFMIQQVATRPSLLGELVRGYFARPMVTKQRAEMPLFPGKDWGTYDVRDSETGVFDGGWAHILVIDGYEWERHAHFRSAFSNTMPFLSDHFAAKPLVMLISPHQKETDFQDRGTFYELAVNDRLSETEWREAVSLQFGLHPEWLQDCPEHVRRMFAPLNG